MSSDRSSMQIVPWNPGFDTGIQVIDEQHRQLVNLLNELAEQYVHGADAQHAMHILDALVDYAGYHFETEEALWQEKFEEDGWLEGHLQAHHGFVDKILSLREDYAENHEPFALDELLSFLTSWLAHHILYDDKRMAVALTAMRDGSDLASAKNSSIEAMSGKTSGLIQSVLSMYKELSSRTLALEREAYARQKAERALKEREAHWRSVLGASTDYLWDWDLHEQKLESSGDQANEAMFSQDGFTVNPDDWPGLQVALLEHLSGQTEVLDYQYRLIDESNQERWILCRGKVIERAENGAPIRIVGTQTDITERKTSELTLKRERDTRQLISEFAADLMSSSAGDFDGAIDRALCRSGQYLGADRTYLFLTSPDGQSMSNTHEWCAPGVSSELENLQSLPVNSTPWWWKQLWDVGYVIVPRVSEMPAEAVTEKALLEDQSIQSVCVYPVFVEGKLAGFLGNDAVKEERQWGREVLEFLRLMSDLLGIALEHRQLSEKRAQALLRLERAERLAHIGHWGLELPSRKASWSQEIYRIFEWNLDERAPDYEGYLKLVHPDDRSRVAKSYAKAETEAGLLHIEHRIVVGGGRVKHVAIKGQFFTAANGKVSSAEGTLQDVTEQAIHEEELERLAYLDPLTQLPNRRALGDLLVKEMAMCSENALRLDLAYIDFDNFKEANERFGSAIGDRLLMMLARRIRMQLGPSVVVSRFGGDEFVVLFTRLQAEQECSTLLKRLLQVINEPVTVGGHSFMLTASIGVTEYPQDAAISEDQLLRQAQQALFQAKLQGKNRVIRYDVFWERNALARTDLLEEIRQGLEQGEFRLHYQPKVNLVTGRVVGVEALIRWQKPSGEILSPAQFLPALENEDLEIEVGNWVIESALNQVAQWADDDLPLQVSINVSGQQLTSDGFVEKLVESLNRHPTISPELVQLEILESSALHDFTLVSSVMERCRAIGISFALDDFGTGFSSLAYLKHLPATVLKIDQSFVRGMLESSDDLSIISGVVGMAKAFGLQAIAEGVETSEHANLLIRLGCEQAQGYGIARPMPAEDVAGWISDWSPEASWGNQRVVPRKNLPLLYAEVEHRHWLRELEEWLSGQSDSSPRLDENSCRVGLWVLNEMQGGGSSELRKGVREVAQLHNNVHDLARAADTYRRDGNHAAVRSHLSDIHDLSKRLLGKLQSLSGQ